MKNAKKTATVIASTFISLCFLAGCAKSVDVEIDGLMKDIDVAPTQTATYEVYTKQALDDYYAVAANHIGEDGDIDVTHEEVIAAANEAAAKLFAYACYNERGLDHYVYFSSQEGDTDLGSNGSATAMRQEYYLRINEQEGVTCGYKYQYTIKKVIEIEGNMMMAKDLFEQGRTRIVVDTDKLYRLEGSDFKVGGKDDVLDEVILKCDWETGDDWGITDKTRIVKGEYIEPDKIAEDIVNVAGDEDITIRANINILAENIVKNAVILKTENDEGVFDGYAIFMFINTQVANKDSASLKMLRRANGSSNCTWVNEIVDGEEVPGLSIAFRIWENGLFRTYSVSEKWSGKINGFSGTADSLTAYYYSYSDRDCDMTRYLEILEKAKADKEG